MKDESLDSLLREYHREERANSERRARGPQCLPLSALRRAGLGGEISADEQRHLEACPACAYDREAFRKQVAPTRWTTRIAMAVAPVAAAAFLIIYALRPAPPVLMVSIGSDGPRYDLSGTHVRRFDSDGRPLPGGEEVEWLLNYSPPPRVKQPAEVRGLNGTSVARTPGAVQYRLRPDGAAFRPGTAITLAWAAENGRARFDVALIQSAPGELTRRWRSARSPVPAGKLPPGRYRWTIRDRDPAAKPSAVEAHFVVLTNASVRALDTEQKSAGDHLLRAAVLYRYRLFGEAAAAFEDALAQVQPGHPNRAELEERLRLLRDRGG